MAEQMRPASKELAPDPSFNYERSHPERESGGQMGPNRPGESKQPDRVGDAVGNRQDPARTVTSDEPDPRSKGPGEGAEEAARTGGAAEKRAAGEELGSTGAAGANPTRAGVRGEVGAKSVGKAALASGPSERPGEEPTLDLPIPGTVARGQPTESMREEPAIGSDAPTGEPPPARKPEEKRNPRIGGKGGTPDVGEKPRRS